MVYRVFRVLKGFKIGLKRLENGQKTCHNFIFLGKRPDGGGEGGYEGGFVKRPYFFLFGDFSAHWFHVHSIVMGLLFITGSQGALSKMHPTALWLQVYEYFQFTLQWMIAVLIGALNSYESCLSQVLNLMQP